MTIDQIIKLQKQCIRIITYSEFSEFTGPLFSDLVINRTIHSYKIRSLMVFHMLKAKEPCFGLKTLRYAANIWNKFYHAFLYKEPTNKNKAQKILQLCFFETSAYLVSISFFLFYFF